MGPFAMKLAKIASSFFLLATLAARADDSKPVALTATPPAVQKSIGVQIGDGTLGEIDQTDEEGETTYDVSFTPKGGDERDFTVADDGTVLSVEVGMADTPPAVQNTIKAQATGWTLEGIDKNLDDPELSFDVEVSKDGQDRTFTVSADGDLVSAEVDVTQTPPAVQAAIKSQVADGNVKSIDENFDPDGNTFDIDAATKEGVAKSFTLGADGSMQSVEVPLDQVPPPARQTIQQQIGNGKVLRVDKSLVEKKKKVLPYEVEGRKDGKEFDFSVGPKGRFLGMDE
jgi:uncharacterized membrane protein YkoI